MCSLNRANHNRRPWCQFTTSTSLTALRTSLWRSLQNAGLRFDPPVHYWIQRGKESSFLISFSKFSLFYLHCPSHRLVSPLASPAGVSGRSIVTACLIRFCLYTAGTPVKDSIRVRQFDTPSQAVVSPTVSSNNTSKVRRPPEINPTSAPASAGHWIDNMSPGLRQTCVSLVSEFNSVQTQEEESCAPKVQPDLKPSRIHNTSCKTATPLPGRVPLHQATPNAASSVPSSSAPRTPRTPRRALAGTLTPRGKEAWTKAEPTLTARVGSPRGELDLSGVQPLPCTPSVFEVSRITRRVVF